MTRVDSICRKNTPDTKEQPNVKSAGNQKRLNWRSSSRGLPWSLMRCLWITFAGD